MLLGSAGAAASGAAMPIFSILFGDLVNAFGSNMTNLSRLQDEVTK